MGRVLIIGAGGVGNVVAKKCAQVPEVFSEICLASRSIQKCKQIQSEIQRDISIAEIDADKTQELIALIKDFKAELVINIALPYQDLTIMDACLATGCHYLDTANYEPPNEAKFCYKWQWDYHERFLKNNITAILGCGFDPGVSNIFCAYALKHEFDQIKTIDILDCNAGNHGIPFATNFNPEINIREITQRGKFWEKGNWVETDPLSVFFDFEYPEVGNKKSFLLYHEELESLVRHMPGLERIRFWMTFSENYLNHLRVLQNIGMTRIDPVEFEGQQIVPLKFLKALLPDPASLGATYTGKTVIGCVISGIQSGKFKKIYIYNVCDHEVCYKEVKAQAVSYTTGVPAMIGGLLLLQGLWKKPGVNNVEQLDPDIFMDKLMQYGLPWKKIIFNGSIYQD